MTNKKRRAIILLLVIVACLATLFVHGQNEEKQYQEAYHAYVERGYEETRVNNLVGAIYLNYRVFDTLFEALLLAVSVTAVVYFATPWEKTKEEEDDEST